MDMRADISIAGNTVMFHGVSMDTRKSSLTILFMVAVINSVIMSGDYKKH